VAIALLVTFLQPYLMSDVHGLRSQGLVQDARRLQRAEGLSGIPVKVQDVHKFTTAPNAEAVGVGPSRRVVLWDTLLGKPFTRNEVRVVLAHEFGHQARHHIWKGLAWYGLFALPIAFVIAVGTRRRGGMREPAAVPLALLIVAVLQLVTLPLQNVLSRRFESEADWIALQTTRDPASARAVFHNLATASLTQPRPPTWAYLVFDNHPTTVQRIAMANAWQARRRAHATTSHRRTR
jgi:STE24 endopeptidase